MVQLFDGSMGFFRTHHSSLHERKITWGCLIHWASGQGSGVMNWDVIINEAGCAHFHGALEENLAFLSMSLKGRIREG